MTEPNFKQEKPIRIFSRGLEELLIRAMEKSERGTEYEPVTFPRSSVERVKRLDENRSLLLLRSGTKIPVALAYEVLERKIYLPNFKADDMDVLDLRELTGKAAQAPVESLVSGTLLDDGSIYLGYHKGKDWFVAAETAKNPGGTYLKPTFNAAAVYAMNLTLHAHKDWEVPDSDILREMFNSQSLGAFNGTYTNWCWSSTPDRADPNKAIQLRFDTGEEAVYSKDDVSVSLRCVRSEPRL